MLVLMIDRNAAATDQVLELGQRWAAAERAGDADALEPLLVNDFLLVGPLGFMLDKTQYLGSRRSGDLRHESLGVGRRPRPRVWRGRGGRRRADAADHIPGPRRLGPVPRDPDRGSARGPLDRCRPPLQSDRPAAREHGDPVKLGMHIAATNWRGGPARFGGTLAEVVEAAEAAGFDAISVTDHVWGSPYTGGVEASQVEAYTTLGFIAARTRRVRLLTLATAASYRHPGLLAKTVTTLDVLSGGRATLGIGAGDYAEEAEGLGLPFPSATERYDLLEETVEACLRMWQGEQGDQRPFHGAHVSMARPLNVPQSLSRPHPPILIAGGGERRTLPLARIIHRS